MTQSALSQETTTLVSGSIGFALSQSLTASWSSDILSDSTLLNSDFNKEALPKYFLEYLLNSFALSLDRGCISKRSCSGKQLYFSSVNLHFRLNLSKGMKSSSVRESIMSCCSSVITTGHHREPDLSAGVACYALALLFLSLMDSNDLAFAWINALFARRTLTYSANFIRESLSFFPT